MRGWRGRRKRGEHTRGYQTLKTILRGVDKQGAHTRLKLLIRHLATEFGIGLLDVGSSDQAMGIQVGILVEAFTDSGFIRATTNAGITNGTNNPSAPVLVLYRSLLDRVEGSRLADNKVDVGLGSRLVRLLLH